MARSAEAQALFKAAVAAPADEVARLVFADWLDETGTPDHAAWARFIRLGTVAHQGAMPPRERADRRTIAGRDVTAKLTLPLAEFANQAAALLQLLPAANVTIKLAAAAVPLPVVAQVWEPTARGHDLLPVAWSGWHPGGSDSNWTERTLIVATPDPLKLQPVVGRDDGLFANTVVHCVRAKADELAAAIDASYARLRNEVAVRALLLGQAVDWYPAAVPGPLDGLDVPPVARLVQGILTDAIHRRATMIRLAPRTVGRLVSMRGPDGWREWNLIPDWLDADVLAYLRELAGGRDAVRLDHHGRPHEFLLEVADTPDGPDVTIHVTG